MPPTGPAHPGPTPRTGPKPPSTDRSGLHRRGRGAQCMRHPPSCCIYRQTVLNLLPAHSVTGCCFDFIDIASRSPSTLPNVIGACALASGHDGRHGLLLLGTGFNVGSLSFLSLGYRRGSGWMLFLRCRPTSGGSLRFDRAQLHWIYWRDPRLLRARLPINNKETGLPGVASRGHTSHPLERPVDSPLLGGRDGPCWSGNRLRTVSTFLRRHSASLPAHPQPGHYQ